jgi:hypothetical protein
MDILQEQLFEMIERCHIKSKTAAVVTPCQMIVSDNPNRNKSMAESVPSTDKVKLLQISLIDVIE